MRRPGLTNQKPLFDQHHRHRQKRGIERRLKTYQTSVGFYDLAIAAPSINPAAEAWGSQTDVFRKALQRDARSGDCCRHNGQTWHGFEASSRVKRSFSEHAELPHLPQLDKARERPAKPRLKRKEPLTRKTDDKTAKANALAFQREQNRREAARRVAPLNIHQS